MSKRVTRLRSAASQRHGAVRTGGPYSATYEKILDPSPFALAASIINEELATDDRTRPRASCCSVVLNRMFSGPHGSLVDTSYLHTSVPWSKDGAVAQAAADAGPDTYGADDYALRRI